MSEKVYKGHNSPFLLEIQKVNGDAYTKELMSGITRVYLKYIPADGASAEYADSNTHTSTFDWTTYAARGKLQIDIGLLDFTVGRDSAAEVVVYDSVWTEGRVVSQLDLQISDEALGDVDTADVLSIVAGGSGGMSATVYDPDGDGVVLAADELVIDPSLSADHSYSGPTSTDTVGEAVSFGDFLYRNPSDKKWYKGKANATTAMPVKRMALASASADATCKLLHSGGIARDDSWDWTDDGTIIELYVSSAVAGTLTEVPDTSSGVIPQIVATPLASNQIEFCPTLSGVRY